MKFIHIEHNSPEYSAVFLMELCGCDLDRRRGCPTFSVMSDRHIKCRQSLNLVTWQARPAYLYIMAVTPSSACLLCTHTGQTRLSRAEPETECCHVVIVAAIKAMASTSTYYVSHHGSLSKVLVDAVAGLH